MVRELINLQMFIDVVFITNDKDNQSFILISQIVL